MPYLIGSDEAGYGPNLGPLVISVTVWWIDAAAAEPNDDRAKGTDLYARLSRAIAAKPKLCGPERIAVADSKLLYSQGKGLKNLERGLFAALASLGRRPRDWTSLWAALDPESANDRGELPWHQARRDPLPIDAPVSELAALEASLCGAMQASGSRLVDIRSRAVFPARFNRLVDQCGSKGEVLSNLTLDLVAAAMQPLGEGNVKIVCDKHGGRNKYADLLVRHFPDLMPTIHTESRELSRYELISSARRVEIDFQAKGESWLPAALASMASKYLRELAMLAFNDFWSARIPGLKSTAGYPLDAKRFKSQIAEVQSQLGIDDRTLWRNR